jgi:hypothetical protein
MPQRPVSLALIAMVARKTGSYKKTATAICVPSWDMSRGVLL